MSSSFIVAALLQTADTPTDVSQHDAHLLMVFVGFIAVSLVIAAAAMVVVAVFGIKLLHRVDGIANIVEKKTGPILDKTNELIAELAPRIQSVTTNVDEIGYTVRAKIEEIGNTVTQLNQTVQQINGSTQRQVARVDGIVSGALLATEELSESIQVGVRAPVRQIAGILAGLRAGLDTLVARSPFNR